MDIQIFAVVCMIYHNLGDLVKDYVCSVQSDFETSRDETRLRFSGTG